MDGQADMSLCWVLMILQVFSCSGSTEYTYHKTPENSDTRKIAVIILKLEQFHFTTEYLVQKMQTKW